MGQIKKILFIEDEKPVFDSFAEQFKKHNIELFSASDGKDGLERLAGEKPDLILLDLILPKMHGFEFLEKVKADPNYRNIPVVILSNLGGELNISKAKDLGAADYFVKTDSGIDQVVEKIIAYLSESKI